MKHESIKERCMYQVSVGGDKKAIVKVVRYNPDTDSWTCQTESGKEMKIKDPKRFLKELKDKDAAPAETPKKKGPAPKEKAPKEKSTAAPKPEPKVSKEEAERLLDNVRKTARLLKVAKEAMENGITIDPKELQRVKREAEDARDAAAEAGVGLKSGGRSNGQMSGLDACHQVLKDEGKARRARELYDLATERGYCDLPGKTPWATIAAALTTDIIKKADQSRFVKPAPGLFDINPKFKREN